MSTQRTRWSAAVVLCMVLACTPGCSGCVGRRLEGQWVVTRIDSGHGGRDLTAADDTIELRLRRDGRLDVLIDGTPWSTHTYDVGLRHDAWATGFVTLRVSAPARMAPADTPSPRRLSLVGDHIVVFRGRTGPLLDQPCCDRGSMRLGRVPD